MTRHSAGLRIVAVLVAVFAVIAFGGEPGRLAAQEATPIATEPDGAAPLPSDTDEASEDVGTGDEADTTDSGFVGPSSISFQPAADVTVLVYAYDCDAEPDIVDPPTAPAGCAAAVGLALTVTANGVDLPGAITDGAGAASIAAPDGSSVVAVEDPTTITLGFVSLGSGMVEITPASEGAVAVLIHVLDDFGVEEPPPGPGADEEEDGDGGRVQLVKGVCPTSGEARTELTVIGPNTFMAQSQANEGCQPASGAEFLVAGGDLPVDGESYLTGEDGSFRGELAPGLYTVTESLSGESAEIEVVLDGIVVVIAFQYVPAEETGTIAVRRYACVEGEVETTSIEAIVDPLEEPGPGEFCVAEDGGFQLNDGEPFNGGGDGAINFSLPTGSYQFTDLDSTMSVGVDIMADATTYVLVKRLLPFGELAVAYALCDAADAYQGDPDDAEYWAETCSGEAAGVELRLFDALGNVVATAITDAEGIARWTGLVPGDYRIRGTGDRATCAVFIDGSASLGGFLVAANTLYQGSVYGCTKPPVDDGSGGGDNGGNPGGGNPGGGNTGGGNSGGENSGGGNGNTGAGTGDDGTGGGDPNATGGGTESTTVTALPQTGSGAAAAPAGIASLVVLAAVGGLAAVSRRRWAA